MFWQIMKPGGGGEPTGAVAQAITAELGGFAAFKEAFTKAAATRFGSGWAWLIVGKDGKLSVTSTPNQDSPDHGGTYPHSRPRCLGTCLLPEVPESPARLPRRLVEHGELGRGQSPLRSREGLIGDRILIAIRVGSSRTKSRAYTLTDRLRYDYDPGASAGRAPTTSGLSFRGILLPIDDYDPGVSQSPGDGAVLISGLLP